MPAFRPPEFPRVPFPTRGYGGDTTESVGLSVRRAEGPSGPPMPSPGERAPHQDAGELISDFVGDLQGAGETIQDALDGPFGAVGFAGPHRLVDNVLDVQTGLVRSIVQRLTR